MWGVKEKEVKDDSKVLASAAERMKMSFTEMEKAMIERLGV